MTQVTWNPAIRQEIEEDTLFLLDLADEEANWTPGNGGLVMNNSPAFDLLPWEDAGSKVSVVAGKFRDGLKPLDASNGFVTMPFFLPASEFTVEAWVKCDVGWSSLGATQYIATFGDRFSQYVHIWISATGTVTARLAHTQTTAGTTTTIGYAAGAFTAGTWHQVAVTLAGSTLTLYVDGVSRSAASSVPSPRAFGYTGRGDGLTIAGLGGEAATHTSVSDLRISRKARVPGVPVEVTAQNTITVGAATGDPINPLLPGGLHTLGGAPSETALAGKLVMLRTDKAISATPIKAGGVDGTHPTLGHSGAYSYDFRAWVHDLEYVSGLGMEFYWSVDSCPQILGGSVAPFSAGQLADPAWRTAFSAFAPEYPNDITAFGTIAADFLHYAETNYPGLIKYAGVWNEPEGSGFGAFTTTQYNELYEATALALKAAVPTIKVGGPEIAAAWDARVHISSLITYCGANNVPLDFVSGHYYIGNVAEMAMVKVYVENYAALAGIPVPELINGEHNFQLAYAPGVGVYPFRDFEWFLNDWGAAFAAWMLIEAQKLGFVRSVYTFPIGDSGASGEGRYGLYSDTQGMWATGNAYDLWSRLGENEHAVTLDTVPGMTAIAAKDDDGRTTVLVTCMDYREDGDRPVTIAGLPSGTATAYAIDNAHSNLFDAGSGHQALETTAVEFSGGEAMLTLKPRAVALLVIDTLPSIPKLVKLNGVPVLLPS